MHAATSIDFIELSAQALSTVVTFGNDQQRDCFDVEIINDSLVKSTEDFTQELTFIGQGQGSRPGVVLQPNLAIVTILDDGMLAWHQVSYLPCSGFIVAIAT